MATLEASSGTLLQKTTQLMDWLQASTFTRLMFQLETMTQVLS